MIIFLLFQKKVSTRIAFALSSSDPILYSSIDSLLFNFIPNMSTSDIKLEIEDFNI